MFHFITYILYTLVATSHSTIDPYEVFQGDTEHGLDGPVVGCVGHLPTGQEMEVEQIEQRTNRHSFQYHPKIDQKFIHIGFYWLTDPVCSSFRNVNVILNF